MKCIASIAAALVIHDLCVSAIDFSGPVVQNTKPARWGYRISDPRMVDCDRWADQWENCGGVRQSPINIVPSKTVQRHKNPLVFSGMCSHFNLSAPHEPLQANQLGGNCGVYLQDVFYMLAHFHLHAPSEHTINGKAMSGEIHFVHKSSVSDDLLVIGVFLVIDVTSDPWLAPLLDALEQVNSAAQTEAVLVQLSPYYRLIRRALQGGAVYNYPGSLTTPGCDETVNWWVVETPISISSIDFGRLHQDLVEYLITANGNNARPAQPLRNRIVSRYT